jgi:hypothetical protein
MLMVAEGALAQAPAIVKDSCGGGCNKLPSGYRWIQTNTFIIPGDRTAPLPTISLKKAKKKSVLVVDVQGVVTSSGSAQLMDFFVLVNGTATMDSVPTIAIVPKGKRVTMSFYLDLDAHPELLGKQLDVQVNPWNSDPHPTDLVLDVAVRVEKK